MSDFDKKTVAAAIWEIWPTAITTEPADADAYDALGTFVPVASTISLPGMGDDTNYISITTLDEARDFSQFSTVKGKEGVLSYLLKDSDAGQTAMDALTRKGNYAVRVTLNDATATTTATKLYQTGVIGARGLPLGDNTAFVICEHTVAWNSGLIRRAPAAI